MNKSIHNGEVYSNEWDHRKIGKEQELFSFHEEGPGFPFFLSKGLAIKNQLIDFWRDEHNKRGYDEIQSPVMLDKALWEKSGHWDLFKENMYVSEIDKRVFAIKPMNCPGAILHFKEKKRSFKELPKKVCELGQVHRNENSGSLHGLLRVRSFVVDDAHIFCSKEDLEREVSEVIQLFLVILKKCGFKDFKFELSVRSKEKSLKYLGDEDQWSYSEKILEDALVNLGYSCERMEGEAKFYGPALDLKIRDSSGREWQCSSVQMDFNLPKRFNLKYYDKDGKEKVPFIIHRAVFGSLERFIGVLLEHHKGDLPLWLAPIQVRIVSISEEVSEYIDDLKKWLHKNGIRFDVDARDENLSSKIKKGQSERIPIMALIGKKEMEEGKISLRLRSGSQKKLVGREEILELMKE